MRTPLVRTWVVGIDQSTKRTAIVIIPPDWTIGAWDELLYRCVEVEKEPAREEFQDAQLYYRARTQRLSVIAIRAGEYIRERTGVSANARVFIEDYAYSMWGKSASVSLLVELRATIAHWMLVHRGIGVVPVVASSARKLLLGKCPQSDPKGFVQAAFKEVHAPFWDNDDLCDAMAVANFGLSELGRTALTLARAPSASPKAPDRRSRGRALAASAR